MGRIVWSPDGEALMLTVAIDACGPPEEGTHTIVRVDAETLSQTTIIPQDDRLFTTEAWPRADRVLLKDQDGKTWWLEPEAGAMEPSR